MPLKTASFKFEKVIRLIEPFRSGPKNIEKMRQALKAIQLGPLSGDELKRIQRIGDYVHANHRRFFG